MFSFTHPELKVMWLEVAYRLFVRLNEKITETTLTPPPAEPLCEPQQRLGET
jgi:hypothetical protein